VVGETGELTISEGPKKQNFPALGVVPVSTACGVVGGKGGGETDRGAAKEESTGQGESLLVLRTFFKWAHYTCLCGREPESERGGQKG